MGMVKGSFVCGECGKVCTTKASLGAHRSYAHGSSKRPPLDAPTGVEVGAASSPVKFNSPTAPYLRVIIHPQRWMTISTPAGDVQQVVPGLAAEFFEGRFATEDPEIIDFLENKYKSKRYPVFSQRKVNAEVKAKLEQQLAHLKGVA